MVEVRVPGPEPARPDRSGGTQPERHVGVLRIGEDEVVRRVLAGEYRCQLPVQAAGGSGVVTFGHVLIFLGNRSGGWGVSLCRSSSGGEHRGGVVTPVVLDGQVAVLCHFGSRLGGGAVRVPGGGPARAVSDALVSKCGDTESAPLLPHGSGRASRDGRGHDQSGCDPGERDRPTLTRNLSGSSCAHDPARPAIT